MARLQKESVDSMSLRLQEVIRLKERITRDESRLILELNSTGIRIERDKVSLAKLKAPSELTDEDRENLPPPGTSEKFNIKY